MKIGFLLSMTDTRSALWVSHRLMMRLAELIDAEGFDEAKRTTAHRGLAITLHLDSLDGAVLAQQTGIAPVDEARDVFLYQRASKPAGCDWVDYYLRLRHEAVRDADDRLARFLDMIRSALAAVGHKAKIGIGALDRWDAIAATLTREVAHDTALHFDRDEDEGTVVA